MSVETHGHIFTDNPVVRILIPVVKDLSIISAIAATGLLLAVGFFIREDHGRLTTEGHRIRKLAFLAVEISLVTIVGDGLVELANLLGGSLLDAFSGVTLRSFLLHTAIGRDYLIQFILGVVTLALVARAKRVGRIYGALGLCLAGIVTPLFQSHSSAAGNHDLVVGSLIFHVLFISLWVGGVLGLLVIQPIERELSSYRFSALALWSAIIVGISGVVNAATRLNSFAAWRSLYGLLVALKVLGMAILILFGALHRKNLAKKDFDSLQLFKLLGNEILVMVGTLAIGGWLATTSPPEAANAIEAGLIPPATPTPMRILLAYKPEGTILAILLLATALYIKGVVTLSRRGDKWPVGRTIAFALAVSAADFATSGGLGVYAQWSFSYHMIAHMVLGMIAPIGFVLSAPITLALRALPAGRGENERGIRGSLIALIHSRYSIILTNPITALAIFDGSLFALYMTPLFGHLMASHIGHLFMDIHFLLAGYLFFYIIVGVDPNPRKIPHLARIIVLFAAMSIHAFFSIALLSSTTLLDHGIYAALNRGWNLDLLADQRTGGAIGWAMGEIPILIALIATFIQWSRSDSKEANRIDRAADRADAMGEEDELTRYNRYLNELNTGKPHD